MKKYLIPLCLITTLSGCAALGPTVGAVGTAVGVSVATMSKVATVVNAGYQIGQVFCQSQGNVVAIVDATTGKPVLATGASAVAVANVCALAYPGAIPTAPPQAPAVVPVAVVAITPAAVPASS